MFQSLSAANVRCGGKQIKVPYLSDGVGGATVHNLSG